MIIKESPVAQNRFYIDYVEQEGRMFTETGEDIVFKDLGKKEEYFETKMLKVRSAIAKILFTVIRLLIHIRLLHESLLSILPWGYRNKMIRRLDDLY
ncbi:MAG: hypothetical protein ACLSFA_15390 [Roseburia inulinivorans]